MNTTPTTDTKPGLIIWPGCHAEHTTREKALDTLKACAFLREPVTCRFNGGSYDSMTVTKPSGLSDEQAAIACDLLCHGTSILLGKFLPDIKMDVIDCDGPMIEMGDGWTMAPSIELAHGYRGAIRWHAFDPEGNPIIENKPEHEVAAALVAAVTAHHVTTHYRAA